MCAYARFQIIALHYLDRKFAQVVRLRIENKPGIFISELFEIVLRARYSSGSDSGHDELKSCRCCRRKFSAILQGPFAKTPYNLQE